MLLEGIGIWLPSGQVQAVQQGRAGHRLRLDEGKLTGILILGHTPQTDEGVLSTCVMRTIKSTYDEQKLTATEGIPFNSTCAQNQLHNQHNRCQGLKTRHSAYRQWRWDRCSHCSPRYPRG